MSSTGPAEIDRLHGAVEEALERSIPWSHASTNRATEVPRSDASGVRVRRVLRAEWLCGQIPDVPPRRVRSTDVPVATV